MTNIKKVLASAGAAALLFGTMAAPAFAAGGFNQYGYNYQARVFSGPADGVDKNLDGTVWGDPTYANDHLGMKWNAQWDNCNANGYDNPTYCLGAWTNNEWNGKVAGGSGEVWHYKIIWVGSAGESSPYWLSGGYSIWGNYEVIMDQGNSSTNYCGSNNGGHQVCTLARPNGYGTH